MPSKVHSREINIQYICIFFDLYAELRACVVLSMTSKKKKKKKVSEMLTTYKLDIKSTVISTADARPHYDKDYE